MTLLIEITNLNKLTRWEIRNGHVEELHHEKSKKIPKYATKLDI